jgi:hypothetical protein
MRRRVSDGLLRDAPKHADEQHLEKHPHGFRVSNRLTMEVLHEHCTRHDQADDQLVCARRHGRSICPYGTESAHAHDTHRSRCRCTLSPPPGGKGRNGRYYGNIIKGLGHCELCAMEPRETSPNPIRQSGRMATPASKSNPLS